LRGTAFLDLSISSANKSSLPAFRTFITSTNREVFTPFTLRDDFFLAALLEISFTIFGSVLTLGSQQFFGFVGEDKFSYPTP
jgi:hypothetical protein